MKYLKVWTSFADVIKPLSDAEKGRLFAAMLHYTETGEEPAEMAGNERFIWPVAKRDIDMAAEWNETCRRNGQKGGRPKTKTEPKETQYNPIKPNETQYNPPEPNDNLKENKRKEKKSTEMECKGYSSFMSDDEASRIQREQNQMLDAAEDAGFRMTNDVRASLVALYADYGLTKMLEGLKSCSEHSAVNLAYLRAVLKGEPKKKPAMKVLPAQDFPQRDYSEVEKDLREDLKRGLAAMKAGEAG